MIGVRVADDQVDWLAFADDLSCGLVQVCRVVCVKVAGIQNHCAVGALHQIHLIAVVILNERYVRNLVAVPILGCAYLQLVVRNAGNIIIPVCNTAGPAVLHRDRLDVIGLGDRTFRACGRLGDLDLAVLVGFKLFACRSWNGCLVRTFRDLVVNVCAVLRGQRDEIGHVVVEYAQTLGGLLPLGERVRARCRRCRRAAARGTAGRTTGRAARTRAAAGHQSRVVDLDNLAGNLTLGRLHFTGLAAENDCAAQLCLVQRNAGCLDDDNTGTLGRCRAGFGDVIRNHVIEQFDDLCAGDIRLRLKAVAVAACDVAVLRKCCHVCHCPRGNAAVIRKIRQAAACRYRQCACQHADCPFAGDFVLRANIFAVTLHHTRLRHTQDRVRVVRRTQISEVVLRLSLVVHYAVYY